MFTDIHSHILYGVDDGPETLEESVQMLKEASALGISTMICTPHLRHEMFEYPVKEIEEHYAILKEKAEDYQIRLLLGCEYHINSEVIEDIRSGRVHTLADTSYVLCEYSYQTEYSRMERYTHKLVSCGYVPVIAHAERCRVFQEDIRLCRELQDLGALIQVNADSVLGFAGRTCKTTAKGLLKKELADILASDSHGISERKNHLAECFHVIERKFSKEYAKELCVDNPGKIANAPKRR